MLCILFINDLPGVVSSSCKLFADDTKIYGSSDNYQNIQDDIHSLFQWSMMWQLAFNISKCKTLHIGKSNPCHTYFVDTSKSESMAVCECEKDVGVVFDRFLNFDLHIDSCVNRATRMLGVILRSFVNLDGLLFIFLYKSLIRSILEYGNCIWSPMYKRQSISIENVQRRATRLIRVISDFSYEDRLLYLDLPSLKYRRIRGDLIQLYRLVHNIDNLEPTNFFTYSNVTFTRGDKFKIYMSRCTTSVRHNSFIQRTLKTWNGLNFNSKNAKSLDIFKKLIDMELVDFKYMYD